MSRIPLPRGLGSSPPPMLPAFSSENLKRKIIPEEDELSDPPRKIPATSRLNRALQPSKTATNLSTSRSNTSKPLTKPRAPTLSTSRTARGTSAPPQSGLPGRVPSKPSSSTRAPVVRSVSHTIAPTDHRFTSLQTQISSLEEARAADSARLAADMESERAKVAELQQYHLTLSKQLAASKDLEFDQRRELDNANDEIARLKRAHAVEVADFEMSVSKRNRELRELNEDLRLCREDIERERRAVSTLKSTISQQSNAQLTLTTENHSLRTQILALQSNNDVASGSLLDSKIKLEAAEKQIAKLKEEAMESEIVRRKLHNMVQELKGNIRVFCRVRPILPSDLPDFLDHSKSVVQPGDDLLRLKEEIKANMTFPDQRDHREIVLLSTSESATGQERTDTHNFEFDRVFESDSTQSEVFEEISQLAQSCVDGYNICIFAYGQTGSGKSFTMEGGSAESSMGMIPRAVSQVFRVAEALNAKGWEYKMEGQFLEIYNETINDLLGKHEFDKKKHEIKHDPKTGSTHVTDLTVIPLNSPTQVRTLLALAQSKRSVAATLMNERSSRSHSVFTLRISGTNTKTGDTCEGSLNLVDLAGSERINVSFGNNFGSGNNSTGDKDRLRETQSINKSLSALGDVISALGDKTEKGEKHIPYRNSKLTYLLRNSLSGNSKTLMFLNLSPLAVHVNESLTSLRFATKVNSTTIGTAKKQSRTS